MTQIGLFAGIGGFELAAHWVGFETIAYCEINPFCQTVLKYYFHNAKAYSDIKTTDFTIYRGQCDILTGGPPCQPASLAGQRKGTTDYRWLWPEAFRAVREIKPRYIVFENPVGIVSLEDGTQFEWILSSLENEGYTTEVYNIPACGIEAPHERQRIWFVAYSNDKGLQRNEFRQTFEQRKSYSPIGKLFENTWRNFPTQSPIRSRNDGLSDRLDGITFPKWRNESIKAFGNAVVPQISYEIFKAIKDIEYGIY